MVNSLPRIICPLCHQQALIWSESTSSCNSCGAVSEYNEPSDTFFYTLVPAEYEPIAPELTSAWLGPSEIDRIVTNWEGSKTGFAPIPATAAATSTLPRGLVWVAVGLGVVCLLLCASVAGLTMASSARRSRDATALPGSLTPSPTEVDPADFSKTASAAAPSPTATIRVAFATLAPTTPEPSSTQSPSAVPLPRLGTSVVPLLVQTANAAESATAIANKPIQPTTAPTPIPPTPTQPADVATSVPGTLPPTFTAVPPTNTPVPDTATVIPTTTPTVTTSAATPTPTATPSPAATQSPAPTGSPTATATTVPKSLVITRVKFQGDADKDETNEFVEIKNSGTTAVNLGGWAVWSRSKNRSFGLPATLIMFGGDTCRFFSGGSAAGAAPAGSNCPKQDLANPPAGGDIWAVGDIAQLRDPANKAVSTCIYSPVEDVSIHEATCN